MRLFFHLATIAALCASATLTAPVTVTVSQETQSQAGGNTPNTALPASLSANTINALKLANFLDNLGLNYFAAGYTNMTVGNSTGWSASGYPSNLQIPKTIKKIIGQELVHIASIETLLLAFNQKPVGSCKYRFPVSTIQEFMALADTIINLGISATQGIAQGIATSDSGLIAVISSMLAVKSRHSAYLRIAEILAPNPTPFDTPISAAWAFNLALKYIVPGSCSLLPLSILPSLSVVRTTNTSISFMWDPNQIPVATAVASRAPLYIGWANQLNVPIYTPLTVTAPGIGTTQIPAGLEGVSFAAMTASIDPQSSIELADATLAGPAIFNSS